MFVCPACKEKRGIDISYGMPGPDLIEQVERSDAVLGGCMQEIGAPDRQCLACGHQWEIARRNAHQPARARQRLLIHSIASSAVIARPG